MIAKMQINRTLCVVLLTFIHSASAYSALIEQNVALTPEAAQTGFGYWIASNVPIPDSSVASGDVIRINTYFANGGSLRWRDFGSAIQVIDIHIEDYTGQIGTLAYDLEFSFIGAAGDLPSSQFNVSATLPGSGLNGGFFFLSPERVTSSYFDFTGFSIAFQVVDAPHFPMKTNSFTVIFSGAEFQYVPEPASAVLTGLGLAAFAIARTRRTAHQAARLRRG
jgi:hypothetical protein